VLTPMPPASNNARKDPFHASCFEHDEQRDVVRCPRGGSCPFGVCATGAGRWSESIVARRCAGAARSREHCTKDRHGRTIEIAPWQGALREHGLKMSRPENAALYRRRSVIVEPSSVGSRRSWASDAGRYAAWRRYARNGRCSAPRSTCGRSIANGRGSAPRKPRMMAMQPPEAAHQLLKPPLLAFGGRGGPTVSVGKPTKRPG